MKNLTLVLRCPPRCAVTSVTYLAYCIDIKGDLALP